MPKYSEPQQKPIGLDVTKQINQRMAQKHISPNIPLLELFSASAVEEAIAQYELGSGRGMILGLETKLEKKFLYVAQSESSTAIWMSERDTKRDVVELIRSYDPAKEAVVVIVNQTTVQLYLAAQGKKTRSLGVRPVDQTPIQLPPDVSFHKEQQGQVFYYVFSHRTLGNLGRIVLLPYGPEKMNIKLEVAGDLADPLTQKRWEIFQPLAHELVERLEAGLRK